MEVKYNLIHDGEIEYWPLTQVNDKNKFHLEYLCIKPNYIDPKKQAVIPYPKLKLIREDTKQEDKYKVIAKSFFWQPWEKQIELRWIKKLAREDSTKKGAKYSFPVFNYEIVLK